MELVLPGVARASAWAVDMIVVMEVCMGVVACLVVGIVKVILLPVVLGGKAEVA